MPHSATPGTSMALKARRQLILSTVLWSCLGREPLWGVPAKDEADRDVSFCFCCQNSTEVGYFPKAKARVGACRRTNPACLRKTSQSGKCGKSEFQVHRHHTRLNTKSQHVPIT